MPVKVTIAWLVALVSTFCIVSLVAQPALAADDIWSGIQEAFSAASTANAPTTTGTEQTTTTDPYKNYLQFDPYKNSSGLTSMAALTYLSGADDPITITYRFINISLSFLGLISTLIIMYAGAVWFFSRDNEEKAVEARNILLGAVIGLIITLGSLSLSVLLFSLTSSVTGNV
jgi:hypothetical protein